MAVVQQHLVYVEDEAVLSNAWAGKLFSRHQLPNARLFAAGSDFTFLVSDGQNLHLLKNSETLWKGSAGAEVKEIKYDAVIMNSWILTPLNQRFFLPKTKKIETVIQMKMEPVSKSSK